MPATRSMKSLSRFTRAATPPKSQKPGKNKRKAQDSADGSELPSQNTKKPRVIASSSSDIKLAPEVIEMGFIPAVLTFSIDVAKQHLISVDARFREIFNKLPCRPFEQLERVDPFSTLTSSILGQQISWLAARSIRHRFIRLYDPSLPEKPHADGSGAAKGHEDFFPTARQVADTDITILKSAGLSTRKAEYIKDLASRFADGRLTNNKLMDADDDELAKLLIEVRGIGRWTVDMFAIFSLRRPDILPVGDLGVQRGLLRWFLSLHSPSDPVTISSKKLPKPAASFKEQGSTSDDVIRFEQTENDAHAGRSDALLPLSVTSGITESTGEDVSSLPAVPSTPVKGNGMVISPPPNVDVEGFGSGDFPVLPEPFTPSINKILKPSQDIEKDLDASDENKGRMKPPVPLPEGLTPTVLRSRLNGKKKIKGALLTPSEMEELTEPWRPYRSLGIYYMWALAEETTAG